LFQDREFAYVTEDIVRETNTKDVSFFPETSHSKKASKLIVLCLAAAARFSLQSVSTESLIPASCTRSHSVKFKTLNFLSMGPSSGS